MSDKAQMGRLALRHEGENWNAYYAMPNTMDGAIPLGSIRMGAVVGRPAIKQAFMDLMREVVTALIQEKIGGEVDWPTGPQAAPEHEKAGHS